MTPADLRQLIGHARAKVMPKAAIAGGGLALVLGPALGLSAVRSSAAHGLDGAQRVAAFTRGDLSATGFERLLARMDPAAIALARANDPLAVRKPFGGLDREGGWRFALDEAPPSIAAQLAPFSPVQGADAERANAAIPFSAAPVPVAASFRLAGVSKPERERAVRCLTNALYYEAALEPLEGQQAVAQVVLNRLRDPNFPKSVCGVVYQGWERLTGCQFSFTCDGSLTRAPMARLWNRERKVAEAALDGHVMASVGTATHYHADYVAPYWGPTLVKITQIGAHIFYRWPGAAGQPNAFTARYLGGELKLSEAVLTGVAARPLASVGVPGTLLVASLGGAGGRVRSTVMVGGVAVTPTADTAAALWGRRQPTPEEVAHINAMLEARFPDKKADTPALLQPSAAATAQPAATPAG